MEEVLELLAADSPSGDKTTPSSASTTACSTTDKSHDISVPGQSYSHVSDTDYNEDDEDDGMQNTAAAEGRRDSTGTKLSNVLAYLSHEDPFKEQIFPRDKEQLQGENGFVQQIPIPTSLKSHARSAVAPRPPIQPTLQPPYHRSSWSPLKSNAGMSHFFCEDPRFVAFTASTSASNPPSYNFATAIPIASSDSTARRPLSPYKKSRILCSDALSKVLPCGQRVHVMNSIEFDELRRKLRMQTASRRYRKRKKEEARQQKVQVLELQAELTRLKEIKSQAKQYQQRSIESLEKELRMHKDEVSDLTEKIQDAAKEEQEWVDAMSSSSPPLSTHKSDA